MVQAEPLIVAVLFASIGGREEIPLDESLNRIEIWEILGSNQLLQLRILFLASFRKGTS
jgi:hypothetical protein